MALFIEKNCEEAIRVHGSDSYPEECCGALLGNRRNSGSVVQRAVRMRNTNTERARDRFALNPLELMNVEKAADREGLELLGFYHSHPDHPADPSLTDLSFAAPWPGFHWIIVSVRGGRPLDMKDWVVEGERFVEVPVKAALESVDAFRGTGAEARR